MTTPHLSRKAIAAGAAAIGALGAIGVAQLAGGGNPVMQFTQAQASSEDSTTTTTPNSGAQARPQKAPLDAETEAKVKAAAEAAVDGSTYQHGHKNRAGDGYKALVTKADGTRVLVHLDNAFAVTKVEDPAPARKHGPRHEQLDAATAAKVKAAAEAAVDGSTYQHGHKNHDSDGYKALVTKADGTKVLVHMDNDFKVTKVEDPAPARGDRGPGDRTPLDAETEAKVKAAAESAVSGATYQRGHKDRDDSGYSALLTKADGTKVLVHLDNEFKVTSVQDPAPARGGRGGRGHGPRPGPDDSV